MREYLLVLLVAAAATYLLATLTRELALRLGAVAHVRDRDVHAVPIPYFGGVAMLGGLVVAFLVALNLPFLSRGSEVLFHDAGFVLLGGALICLVGVVDDVLELDAITKFAGQLLAAGVVVLGGVQFLWLPGAEQTVSLDASQAALLTVFMIVATSNAVNFIDGLDGLAAGVVAIGAAAFFVFAYVISVLNNLERGTPAAFLTMALVGVCLGILPHNFFPAQMFIGDAGAMLIGFVLACSAITLTGQYPSVSIDSGFGGASASVLPALLPLVLPFAVLVVPFVDLVLAVVRRTRAGRSPFAPDKQHLHHRLLEIGHSHRRAVLLMYLWTALLAGGTVVVSLFTGWQSVLGVAVMVVLAIVLTFGLTWWRRDRPQIGL
jgi:UDP-GlcNAc:undecaprenyl-phosphate GlcNAc-1-phosphate transferase